MDKELAVDIMIRVTELLNEVIIENGSIEVDNKYIWKTILHQMDNNVWHCVLDCVEDIECEHPAFLEPYQREAFDEARQLLHDYDKYYDKVLDKKTDRIQGKRVAWRCLMSIREIVCKAWDVQLSNHRTASNEN